MKKYLNEFEKYLIVTTIVVYPLFFLPIFANPFVTGKLIFLGVMLFGLVLSKIIKIIEEGKLTFSFGIFDFPVFLLSLSYIISAISKTPNKVEAFFLPGTATFIIFFLLFYLIFNQVKDRDKKLLDIALAFSATLLSLVAIIVSTRILNGSGLPAFMQRGDFNPLGGLLPASVYLLIALPIAIKLFIKEKVKHLKVLYGSFLFIIVFGAISVAISLISQKTFSSIVNLSTSWVVTVDTLKVSPVLGIGPANYLTSFNRFRPLSFNSNNTWNLRYSSASNFYLTSITETGLLGLASILILLYIASKLVVKSYKDLKIKKELNINIHHVISLTIMLILLFVLPIGNLVLLPLALLLSLSSPRESATLLQPIKSDKEVNQNPFVTRIHVMAVGLISLSFIGFIFIKSINPIKAEYSYRQAILAISKNDGKSAYELLNNTISLNPYADRYHTSYAQINLALANAVAGNENLSEEDRQTIAQLAQQAIREGKASVTLNPQRSGNWALLASIYRSLMPVAQGADEFAIQTYIQAINLDPLNTDVRINLGGLYYSLQRFDDAIDTFKLAVLTKPDYANAHYNLALSYKAAGQVDKAISEMTTVLSLVNKSTKDYELARTELENLQNKKASKSAETKEGESLKEPEDIDNELSPKIELPEDSNPPEAESNLNTSEEVSPEPSPTSSPSRVPSPTPKPAG